jgi:hypothetical protein
MEKALNTAVELQRRPNDGNEEKRGLRRSKSDPQQLTVRAERSALI